MGSRESAASYLSDDLIVEILSRLPARSVLRFKGVSRYWRDLISHPDHHRKFAQTVSGFFYYTVTAASSHRQQRICASFVAMGAMADGQQQPPLPMQIDPAFLPGMELLDSCNGLLLLRGYRSSPLPAAAGYFYVVCNPTTRQWAELPQPSHPPGEFGGRRPLYYYYDRQEKSRTRSAALAFDPAVSSHFHSLPAGGEGLRGSSLRGSRGDLLVGDWEVGPEEQRLGRRQRRLHRRQQLRLPQRRHLLLRRLSARWRRWTPRARRGG
ncbi:hypothetical protein EJB05_18784, partial [Eragrostis curvula]